MSSLFDINSAISELTTKRDEILTHKIKTEFDQNFNLQDEAMKMFPRLRHVCIPSNNRIEKWYWNDGSDKGKLIVTFSYEIVPADKSLDIDIRSNTISFILKYD